jgi:glycosyltransferase involved in cell wall biosynthesis
MDRDRRVAVVMITRNRRSEVLHSLDRLTQLPERPAIVVVDNGSEDGTPAAIAGRFPQVQVVAAGQNLGAAGRTLGVHHVDAPYVAFSDDDTWWEPGSLARAAELFDRHPRLAVATARILVGPDDAEDPVCRELEASPLPAEPGMPGPPLLGFMAGASVLRRRAFLAADLAASGWWLCYVPQLIVHHYPSQQRDVPTRRWHLVRNALWSAWLRRPLTSAVRKTVWLARAQPWDRAAVRGFAAAVAGLPWVLRHRRVVPEPLERRFRLLDPPDMGRSPTPRRA